MAATQDNTENNTENAENGLTAGAMLKEARERQGLSLEAVCAKTRISAGNLAALEAADYAALPADTYTRGYLREYARLLGLDPASLAADFFHERGSRPRRQLRDTPSDSAIFAEPVQHSPATGALILLAAIILVVGLFCACTGWNPLAYFLSDARRAAHREELAFHPAPPEAMVEINARAINLEAHFLKDTEVRLQVDGNAERRAVYVRESTANWEADSSIRIEFAKPRSAELRVNGRPLGFPPPNNGQYLLSLRARPGAS